MVKLYLHLDFAKYVGTFIFSLNNNYYTISITVQDCYPEESKKNLNFTNDLTDLINIKFINFYIWKKGMDAYGMRKVFDG